MDHIEEHWQRTQRLFHEVAAIAEPERTAILQARCEGDTALMDELRSLLRACESEEKHRDKIETSTPNDTRNSSVVGPYELDRLLGRGGMGAVYLAHRSDGQFHQQVAIKLIDMPVAGEFFRERFRQERQILAHLAHPFIARLLGGGVTESGELYLALEYVEGISISRYCAENHLTLRARLQLFLQVCYPSRPEAGQYPRRHRWHAPSTGLRYRQAAGTIPDRGRLRLDRIRLAVIHTAVCQPRAGAGRPCHDRLRHLLTRCPALCFGNRCSAVHPERVHHGRDAPRYLPGRSTQAEQRGAPS
jgi:hypothetical protein